MDDRVERVVLVDEQDRAVGEMAKLEAHREPRLHRAVSVFAFDAAGRLLLQRRATTKYHSGGLWANTCCGHPRPGEAPADAARRRLREEMGIDAPVEFAFAFTYRAELPAGLVEHEYDHVYVARHDGPAQPDAAEVGEWRYLEPAQVSRELAEHPGRFAAWFEPAWRRLREHRAL